MFRLFCLQMLFSLVCGDKFNLFHVLMSLSPSSQVSSLTGSIGESS